MLPAIWSVATYGKLFVPQLPAMPSPPVANQRLTDPTVSSAANATNESGGEAEPKAGWNRGWGAAARSLRSVSGAAHSVSGAHLDVANLELPA